MISPSSVAITLCGAAGGEVTGSGYLVHTPRATVLVDFGFFQGRHDADTLNASIAPVDPARLDAVVLTHAHLDHIGRLPLLARAGYRGPIHATAATADLTAIMLEDAAKVAEQDAQRENRHRTERHAAAPEPPAVPLYTHDNVALLGPLMRPIRLNQRREIAPGVSVRFFEAGHILGSASIEMQIAGTERDQQSKVDGPSSITTILFSGDIGQRSAPILCDPITPAVQPRPDLIFLESTYGDRDHRSQADSVEEFREVLKTAVWDKRRILIPAFAVGRTQTVLYHIAAARREGVIPEIPVYLDSPLADRATSIYARHQDLYDQETGRLAEARVLEEQLSRLRVLKTVAESRALNDSWEPCIIIAGSGMCEGGRIVHHLRHSVWRRNVSVILTGYQAQGTLGRRLADRAREVFIFGDRVPVRAGIHTIGGFSAHAGQTQLIEWMMNVASDPRPKVALTHGEDPQRAALAAKLRARYGIEALRPAIGESLAI
jgi:metallo-beta-lactamase family protein